MPKSRVQSSASKDRMTKGLIPFLPGQSGNPKGRAKGQRNYATIYREALERIGNAEGYTLEEIEDAMTVKAIQKAIKGDFFFYRDVHDRIHGKPKETIDLGSGGKTLFEIIASMNGKSSGGAKRASQTARKNKK